jgi:hypothetical protein
MAPSGPCPYQSHVGHAAQLRLQRCEHELVQLKGGLRVERGQLDGASGRDRYESGAQALHQRTHIAIADLAPHEADVRRGDRPGVEVRGRDQGGDDRLVILQPALELTHGLRLRRGQ